MFRQQSIESLLSIVSCIACILEAAFIAQRGRRRSNIATTILSICFELESLVNVVTAAKIIQI